MSKIIEKLRNLGKKENPYKDLTTQELEEKKENLRKQREFCNECMFVTESGFSANKGVDGAHFRPREDSFYIQIKSIEREINKIDAELRRRKEQEDPGCQPGVE